MFPGSFMFPGSLEKCMRQLIFHLTTPESGSSSLRNNREGSKLFIPSETWPELWTSMLFRKWKTTPSVIFLQSGVCLKSFESLISRWGSLKPIVKKWSVMGPLHLAVNKWVTGVVIVPLRGVMATLLITGIGTHLVHLPKACWLFSIPPDLFTENLSNFHLHQSTNLLDLRKAVFCFEKSEPTIFSTNGGFKGFVIYHWYHD